MRNALPGAAADQDALPQPELPPEPRPDDVLAEPRHDAVALNPQDVNDDTGMQVDEANVEDSEIEDTAMDLDAAMHTSIFPLALDALDKNEDEALIQTTITIVM